MVRCQVHIILVCMCMENSSVQRGCAERGTSRGNPASREAGKGARRWSGCVRKGTRLGWDGQTASTGLGIRGWWEGQRSRARLQAGPWPPGRADEWQLAARSPAEVQQRPSGCRSALCRPAEEVELSERARLLGLHVLKVEAPHQEVLAPDVLRHQVHL